MPGGRGNISYWSSLERSLTDRADALMEYTETLLADSDRSDDGFTRALKMCRLYTRVFVETLREDIANAESDEERREVAEGHLEDFIERYERIDRWLSRGSQGSVPRALQTICRRQFDAARLPDHEPVLTVGAPDSFEAARTPDLHELLFGGLTLYDEESEKAVEALRQDRALAIISVPYIEGTRTLWYPITIGHEICHVRLAESGAPGREIANVASDWIAKQGVLHEAAVKQLEAEGVPDPKAVLLNTFRLWAVEIVCDLNAVRLFGPAGARAIAEFVSMGEDVSHEDSYQSTHPPSALRLEIMLRYLEKLGFPTKELHEQVRAWPEPPVVAPSPDPVTLLLVNALDEASDALIEIPASWGFQLENDEEFDQTVSGCVDALLDGAPCGTHLCLGGRSWEPTTTAHVVNAAWHAREELAAGLAPGDDGEGRALLRLREPSSEEEQRLLLDQLASKAIDSIELARLWRDEVRIVAPKELPRGEPLPGVAEAQGGVLSSLEITDRLAIHDQADPRRLLVTPLFSDAVCEAGLDLRLGPDFIVFRHSATPAFNPLSREQDPRMVQKRVTKPWGEQFVLHPNELVLAATLEYIVIPSDLSAQVITRSSYGRLGLMTATAVQVQPGSRGCITLELKNQSETPIVLTPGARVAQLILWTVVSPAIPQPAKYWFPTGPEFSKAHDDRDATELKELGRRIHERHQNPQHPVDATFVGSTSECIYFAATASAVISGAPDIADEPPNYRFAASPEQLARLLQRWGSAQDRGTEVLQREGRSVEIRLADSVGKGEVGLGAEARTVLPCRDPDPVSVAIEELLRDPDCIDPAMGPL